MAAGAVSLKYLTKREEVRKLEKELIRLIMITPLKKMPQWNTMFDDTYLFC